MMRRRSCGVTTQFSGLPAASLAAGVMPTVPSGCAAGSLLPQLAHSNVHRSVSVRRGCGSMPTRRVAPPHFSQDVLMVMVRLQCLEALRNCTPFCSRMLEILFDYSFVLDNYFKQYATIASMTMSAASGGKTVSAA